MPWVAPALGSGLGNRLFQYAAAAGLAERWGLDLVFLVGRSTEAAHGAIATLFRMFPSVPLLDTAEPYAEVKEPGNAFYEYIDMGDTPPPNSVVVSGARQSPGYFPKDIRPLLPDWNLVLGAPIIRTMIERDAGLDSDEQRRRTVSIHIRLGDYKGLAQHQVDLGGYYMNALNKVEAGARLHLFSDEPHLCADLFARQLQERGIEYTVAKVRSDAESLYEMSLCLGGNIVANSTFSWWGAWFAHHNGSRWATYPSNWGKGMPEPTSLFPEWGIVMRV